MSAPKDTPVLYAASCNPPRRAKRQRTGSLVAPEAQPTATASSPMAPSPQQRRAAARPPILPKQLVAAREYVVPASPNSESVSDEEDDYDPSRDAAPAPKRRGRKPGTMSRSTRESLRKLNHSRIEKARRTKINETLATLSTLVNEREQVLPADSPQAVEVNGDEEKKAKGKPEEKEFKLDVLVKTVEYMQGLVARVQMLEGKMCTQCRVQDDLHSEADVPPSPKRKRSEDGVADVHQHITRRLCRNQDEEDSYGGDDEHGLAVAEEELPSPMPFAAPASRQPTQSPRLPPIASWLPHPYVDPSSLMSTSHNAAPMRSPVNAQLPSPPPSGRFRPAITLANMPALVLPAPAHPLGPPPPSQKTAALPPLQRQQRNSVSASPTVSPTWTPEDETAASLLLQISSKPRSSSTSSAAGSPSAPFMHRSAMSMAEASISKERVSAQAQRSLEVVTPGALLGMRD